MVEKQQFIRLEYYRRFLASFLHSPMNSKYFLPFDFQVQFAMKRQIQLLTLCAWKLQVAFFFTSTLIISTQFKFSYYYFFRKILIRGSFIQQYSGVKYRSITGSLLQAPWACGYAFLALVAYLSKSWYTIQVFKKFSREFSFYSNL